eukprot:2768378-Alexandrium_andersonii.AAC.1
MSVTGEQEMPEATAEDIDEEMGLLMNLVQEGEDRPQEGSESLRLRTVSDPCDAPDFIRALFTAGATPGEAVSYTHLRAHETSAHL